MNQALHQRDLDSPFSLPMNPVAAGVSPLWIIGRQSQSRLTSAATIQESRTPRLSDNPNGIASLSPGLVRQHLPWVASKECPQPRSGLHHLIRHVGCNPFRIEVYVRLTPGSACNGPRRASARHAQPGANGLNPVWIQGNAVAIDYGLENLCRALFNLNEFSFVD